jgi:N-acetylglucosaminyldiphosphoundecaprenol N-acetyl-beta-D-mannosaminyltransferase
MAIAQVNTFGRKTIIEETREFGKIVSKIANKDCQSAFFCNVHMLMLSQEDVALANAMDNTDWVFADGVPVAWLQRRVSGKNAKVVRGYEIMLAVCERAAINGETVGFFGSTEEVMKDLVKNIQEQFNGLNIVYQYCPPCTNDELISTQQELQSVLDSNVNWLFVGLGCPKQEKWIARYKHELNCNILGVGAAFDWVSGQVSMPPRWVLSSGLGWLYRLLQNPKKMWRRYLIYNSKFIYRVIKMSLVKD